MYCAKCGRVLGNKAVRFCAHCGAPVGARAPSPSHAPEPASSEPGFAQEVASRTSESLKYQLSSQISYSISSSIGRIIRELIRAIFRR